jgi:uncharacterized protein (DUF362 family)
MSATVAIAHTRDKLRSSDRVLALVREALDLLGGMQSFVSPGQSVLIKPDTEGFAADPLVVDALVRLATEAGAAAVQVAGSAAGAVDLGGDDVPNRVVEIPLGKVTRRAPLPAPLLDADVLIAVPKAKTHYAEPVSGAMRLWMDTVNRSWRGFNTGDAETVDRFVDLMTVSRPDLCVVDALVCGEGDGPAANLPRWAGCILASTDPVATDVAIAQLMGLDWKKLCFAEAGETRGLGVRQPVAWLGVPCEEVAFHAWPAHQGFEHLPVEVLAGGGVTLEGTLGHVRCALDGMARRGELPPATIMLGDIEDPAFEEHLRQGPYIVIDDAARPEYKRDPRVHFIPGHPVLHAALPALRKALGVDAAAGPAIHAAGHGAIRKAVDATAPLAVAALAVVGGLWGINALTRKKDEAEVQR